jgi:L-ascorbate metabolism protein UlaG (beta-lactamase superfamily)
MTDQITFVWYGHSCFELRLPGGPGGYVVLVDPWFGNPTSPKAVGEVDKCDMLLVSHGHFDHLGSGPRGVEQADALAIAHRTKPVWPCIHELSLWLEIQLGQDGTIVGMNKGGTFDAGNATITMVHADHSAGDWSAAGKGPLYLGEPVGFVIGLPNNGRRIYYSGDTDVFGDMALIGEMYRPEVAILPIGGHYTMGPEGAARAAQLLGVRAVVPVHYGTFPILAGSPTRLRQELAHTDIEVVAPEPGVATSL